MFKISYIYDLVDEITPQLKKIQSNLEATRSKTQAVANSMANSFNSIGESLKKTSQSLKNVGSTLAPASIAMGLIGTKAITSASNFETLGIQLEILTGSAEKGKQLFQELATFSAQTPFELPEITKATNLLLGATISLDKVVPTLKVLGDVSAGSGADLQGLARVFGQVAGATRLLGQDANQFIQNSIPIYALLSKTTGKNIDELKKLGEQGQISFDLVNKALTQATEKGGMYYKATERLSKSLGGLYSTLRDNVNMAFGELGAEMVKAINLKELITKISDFAGKLTEKFKSLSPETKKFITYAVLIVGVLAPVALILGSLVGVVGLIISGFGLMAGAFAFLFTPLGFTLSLFARLAIILYNLKDELIIIKDFLVDKFASAFDYVANKIKFVMGLINQFRADTAIVLDFIGLDKLSSMVAPDLNQPTQINKPQQLTAGGQLDVNIKGLPQGSNAGFTPRPNNFLPVGVNSVFAGF